MSENNFISVAEAAGQLKLTASRVRLLCSQGRVEGAQKVGRNWVIPESALETLEIKPVGRPKKHSRRK